MGKSLSMQGEISVSPHTTKMPPVLAVHRGSHKQATLLHPCHLASADDWQASAVHRPWSAALAGHWQLLRSQSRCRRTAGSDKLRTQVVICHRQRRGLARLHRAGPEALGPAKHSAAPCTTANHRRCIRGSAVRLEDVLPWLFQSDFCKIDTTGLKGEKS